MSRSAIQIAAASITVLATAIGACAPPEAPRFVFKHAERRGRFPNGLKFVLLPDATTPMVEVDVRYDVGAREDPPGKAGLAHLVEHLMFQHRPDGPASPALSTSLTELSTYSNAYTDRDNTHYTAMALADRLDALVKIEAIRMFYGCQTIPEAQFQREREVVRNEIRQRSATAESQIPNLLAASIYPRGHAYERPIGGDDRQLSTITLDDACAFIARYYAPERATVVIAGGFDVDTALASLDSWFGRIARRSAAPRTPVVPVAASAGTSEVELDVQRPSLHVMWPLPPYSTAEGEAVQFGLFNTLSQIARLAADYEFAYRVEADTLGGDQAPVFVISLALRDLDKRDEAIAFVRKAARQAYRGFDEGTQQQIEEFQNLRKAAFIASLEPLTERAGLLADLVQRSDFDSRDQLIAKELDKIGRYDGPRIAAAIKQYIDPDRARIVVIRPSKHGQKGDIRSALRLDTRTDDDARAEIDPRDAQRPLALPTEISKLAQARRFTLDNGLQVVLLPIHAMPLVAARLIFNNAGRALVPDSPALAGAAAGFLTPPVDATAFTRTGVSLGCAATFDATVCEGAGISLYADVVIRGLERLVTVGTYSQPAIERWQGQSRHQFDARARQDLEHRRQLLTAIYGADHPYTKADLFTPQDAAKIHLDSLNAFRRAHYSAGNATLVVVGDFQPLDIERQIRDSFAGWARGTTDRPVDRAPAPRSGPVVVGVAGRDVGQLRVIIGYPGPPGIDDMAGARAILTAMVSLRVGSIREQLGSSYGMYARHTDRKGPTSYELGGYVDPERGGESLRALRGSIELLRKGDHFDHDFVRARRKVLSDLLAESTVTAELADRLSRIAIHGLAPDHDRALLRQVAAATPAQVRALLDKELHPSHEAIVVLGDRDHLIRAFDGAGLAGARIVEPADH